MFFLFAGALSTPSSGVDLDSIGADNPETTPISPSIGVVSCCSTSRQVAVVVVGFGYRVFTEFFFCVWLDSSGQTVVDDTFLLRPELVLILFAFFTGSFFLDLRPASIASASAAAGHPAGSTSSFYWSASWCSPRSSKTASGQQRL